MKKFLSVVLLGVMVLSAFPVHAKGNLTGMVQAGAKAVQNARRQTELNKKALQSIPEKAKTYVRFRMMETWDDDGMATFSDDRCPAIFMDYNEANGLGNVTVGMKESCVKEIIEQSFFFTAPSHRGWMEFGVYMLQFGYDPRIHDDIEDFMFLSEVNAIGNAYPELIFKQTAVGNLFIYHMPVQSSSASFQRAFKQMFPTQKSFITLEKAARALNAMR